MSDKNTRTLAAIAVATALSLAMPLQASAQRDVTTQIDVPAQPLAQAIQAVARQTSMNILVDPKLVAGREAPALRAEMSVNQALDLLLQGTGLTPKFVDDKTITLVAALEPAKISAGAPQSAPMRLAQSEPQPQLQKSANQNTQSIANAPADLSSKLSEHQILELIVTGSRIASSAVENAPNVQVYTREQIQRSGQPSVSEFLNSLPSMSINSEQGHIFLGATTPRLRGLPIGSTLVLINGQRVQTSGAMGQMPAGFFDLASIPLGVVERIDVLADGASAIYGSDAIAGVVNVILRSDIDEPQVTARYGSADDISDMEYTAAWGKQWERGRVSLFASFQNRGELRRRDRALSADNDYTRFGGPNGNLPVCNPGNVFFPTGFSFNGQPPVAFAAVPNTTGNPTLQDFAATAATLNTCALAAGGTLLPDLESTGIVLSGSFDVSPALTLFTDVLYSRFKSLYPGGGGLVGVPGFQQFSMGPDNPYNPFGQRVGISYALGDVAGINGDTEFVRPMIGARGRFGNSWSWQLTGTHSEDETDNVLVGSNIDFAGIQAALDSADPATAFNPFARTHPISPDALAALFTDASGLFKSNSQIANGFVRGTLFNLPTGDIEAVLGAEYVSDELSFDLTNYPLNQRPDRAVETRTRNVRAAFGEIKVPLLSQDRLALSIAGRHDDYSDFGSTSNPQYTLQWRPLRSLVVRGSYADAFKAPSLAALYDTQRTVPNNGIIDPSTGTTVFVSTLTGGNPDLDPEVGRSKTLGVTYSSEQLPGLSVSSTYWSISMHQAIVGVGVQFIVDNEASYPGRVIRDSGGAITLVDVRRTNYGSIDVAGFDHQIAYQLPTSSGNWTASLGATHTRRYDAQLVAGAPATDRAGKANADLNWSPRWKGTARLGWQRAAVSASLTGRYVDEYRDYNSTSRYIGDFWLYDANLRYDFGQQRAFDRTLLDGGYLELGGVNVGDKEPQFSAYSTFSGYDPAQADIRGRYWYLSLGVTF